MSDDLVIGIALTALAYGGRAEPRATKDRLVQEFDLETAASRLRTATTESGDVADRILAWVREHEADTIVMGATEEGLFRQALFGAIPEAVGERFDGTVLMVRQHLPLRSTLRSWARRWFGRSWSRSGEKTTS